MPVSLKAAQIYRDMLRGTVASSMVEHDPHELRSNLEYLEVARFLQIWYAPMAELMPVPIVIVTDQGKYIFDGHHRCLRCILTGERFLARTNT